MGLLKDRILHIVKKENPNIDVEIDNIYKILDSYIVTRKQTMDILGLSKSGLIKYESKGLKRSAFSSRSQALYDLKYLINWVVENVDYKFSNKKRATTKRATEEEELGDDWDLRKKRADALKTEAQASKEELLLEELDGVLVKKDEIDKSMADLGATMGGFYRNDLKSLPVLLENKSQFEIQKILDEHYRNRMYDMRTVISKELGNVDDEDLDYALDKLYEWMNTKIG